MTPPQACKWCKGTGKVNRYNPEKLAYQDYDCGFCAPEAEEIQEAAEKALRDLFPDRTKEATPWEI